jgi:DNA polymerase-3 subunit delta'
VRDQQHHAMIWLYPEKQYTLDQIDVIFKRISFALDAHETFFFILQKADFLSAVCANRLLKPIEEPPVGYHFLLLAERGEQILPTIRSRCVSKSFYTKGSAELHPDLFACFTNTKKQSPLNFMKVLQASKINERESVELIDMLLKHWIKKYKNASKKFDSVTQEKTKDIIAILKKHMVLLPMPGSSKLFWKNLFLQMHM